MREHSPLPWTPRRSQVFGTTDIRDVYDAERREVHLMGFGLTGGAKAAANADLIVRAVNAHDELYAALKWFVDDIDGTHTVMVDFDCNVERARKALAVAEGRS